MAGVTRLESITGEVAAILFSNVQVTKRKHSARKNLTIHISNDDGMYGTSRTIEPGPSAYSISLFSIITILCSMNLVLHSQRLKIETGPMQILRLLDSTLLG